MPALQDATHVLVQRSAQTEIDLDLTAVMLCDEMTQGAANRAAMLKLQEMYALEQKHCKMAMTVTSGLNLQLCIRDQELRQSNEQLLATLVSFGIIVFSPDPRSSHMKQSCLTDCGVGLAEVSIAQLSVCQGLFVCM